MGRPKAPPAGSLARAMRDAERDRQIVEYVHAARQKFHTLESAIEDVTRRLGVDRRTVQRALKRERERAPLAAMEHEANKLLGPTIKMQSALQREFQTAQRVAQGFQLIHEHITPTELEQMRQVRLSTIVEFARGRATRRPIPHLTKKNSGRK